jgi:hypothetical protein
MADIIKHSLILLSTFQYLLCADLRTTTIAIQADSRFEPIQDLNFPPMLGMAAPANSNNDAKTNRKFPGFRTSRGLAKFGLEQSYPNYILISVNDFSYIRLPRGRGNQFNLNVTAMDQDQQAYSCNLVVLKISKSDLSNLKLLTSNCTIYT